MYEGDSFHTLTPIEQIGLALLSLSLVAALLYLIRRTTPGRPVWLRLLAALLVFALFIWLSPQVYYTYYLMIFDDLPLQVVIRTPPTPQDLLRLLTLQAGHSISEHSKAALGWALLIAALWPTRRTNRRP